MTTLLPRPVLVIWAILTLATALSWWTSADSGLGAQAAGATILLISFAKAWLVADHFMELRHAPGRLRWSVAALLALLCAALVAWLLAT
ncbi:cytochrome C oxidase subunit IV family protein [Patulibacter brassicae]|uniref:Cytochrome C oxidase subunit IV family protein n=1 Tax=Patulibacter brassicae TaxID=1705717 RepID=A0ABU4VN68_9ACTN|nr:cytochrome C oxidase subunit IV family protein [Patulibacter brassicae]MDX8153263.1 cytochrome C oxidase subunit IV family protein [Patulibacter brassicae]